VSTNDATYIYNQGRCYEQNGKDAQAVLRFKEYLRKAKGLPQADADAVRKKIGELEAATGQKATKPEGPAPASQPAPVLPAPLSQPAATPTARETQDGALGLAQASSSPEPPASVPVYKRWWFWTGIGALVAGGVVTGILLSQKPAPTSPPCDGLGTCVQH
jgi:hypothetical protein